MSKDLRLKDYLVSRIMAAGKTVEGYSRIYYMANEDLIDTYLDVDFKDKEVLSILASGDHVLTSDYLNAKRTDSFASNRLELYYYYLRIWAIEHQDCLYPNLDYNTWLTSLLTHVKPRNEQEKNALSFFKQHSLLGTDLTQLFYDTDLHLEDRTLFSKASELKDCINPNLVYYQTSLFDKTNIDSTYDIVLLSKMLNWARGDKRKLKQVKENLEKIVRKDGTVICSNQRNTLPSDKEFEIELFSDSFEYEKKKHGYVYIKKN